MKTGKVLLLVLILLIALVSPLSTSYAEDAPEGKEETRHSYEGMYLKYDKLRPHFNYYYELLIERHEPALKEEWTLIVQERETLIKKYREMKKEGKLKDADFHNLDEEWNQKHQDVQERFLQAVKERNDDSLKMLLSELIALQKEMNEYLQSVIKNES
ncbi:hypothetical protein [Alteribacter lacisalsi]|nr:hypothetical protein [Alteribacter lacisalsi]